MKGAVPADATVMKPHEVAKWLQVKERQLERMGVPYLHLGHKTRRYLKSDVMAWLQKQRRTA